jgi:hypothetical protein
MMDSRGSDGSGADFAVRGEHLLDGAEGAAAELARHCVGTVEIRIDHTYKSNRLALLFEFAVNAGVIASENTNTDYCDGNRIVSLQGKNSRMAGCQRDQQIVNVKLGKSILRLSTFL